jgi:hypothetical protein
MESVSLRIIKSLTRDREMDLRDVAALLPKKTNDHLDYYALASLVKSGYVDMSLDSEDEPFNQSNEMKIAISLFMWVAGGDKEFEYRGMRSQGADFGKEKVFATAKAYLLLDEMRRKRAERVWAFSAGIITAIVATLLRGLVTCNS